MSGLDSFIGGLFGGSDRKAGRAITNTAQGYADDITFKPVGLTTRGGSASYDPTTGRLSTFGGNPIADTVQRAENAAQSQLRQFNNFDVDRQAQDLAARQFDLIQPQLQAQQANLAQTLFGSGRGGLAVSGSGTGAGSGMVNPDIFGFNQSTAQLQNQIAQDAYNQAYNQRQDLLNNQASLFNQALQGNQFTAGQELELLKTLLAAESARSGASAAAGKIGLSGTAAGEQLKADGDKGLVDGIIGVGKSLFSGGLF